MVLFETAVCLVLIVVSICSSAETELRWKGSQQSRAALIRGITPSASTFRSNGTQTSTLMASFSPPRPPSLCRRSLQVQKGLYNKNIEYHYKKLIHKPVFTSAPMLYVYPFWRESFKDGQWSLEKLGFLNIWVYLHDHFASRDVTHLFLKLLQHFSNLTWCPTLHCVREFIFISDTACLGEPSFVRFLSLSFNNTILWWWSQCATFRCQRLSPGCLCVMQNKSIFPLKLMNSWDTTSPTNWKYWTLFTVGMMLSDRLLTSEVYIWVGSLPWSTCFPKCC